MAKKTVKAHRVHVRNILSVWNAASRASEAEGRQWYERAHEIANDLSTEYGVTLEQAAGVISALSPSNKWSRNVRDAEAFISDVMTGGGGSSVSVCTYPVQKEKALRILTDGHSVNEIAAILGGNKTVAFFACIADPSSDFVVVDGHALNIATNNVEGTASSARIRSRYHYECIARAYIVAAEKLGEHPSTVQAVTWCAWRNNDHT